MDSDVSRRLSVREFQRSSQLCVSTEYRLLQCNSLLNRDDRGDPALMQQTGFSDYLWRSIGFFYNFLAYWIQRREKITAFRLSMKLIDVTIGNHHHHHHNHL